MYGRNGEAPIPIVAPQSPSDCFYAAFEAARIALTYRTPVIVLSDGFLANSSEPWLLPDPDELPTIDVEFTSEPNHPDGFLPLLRDPDTLARPWAMPGHARGCSTASAGSRSTRSPATSATTRPTTSAMTELRHARVEKIAESLPPLEVDDPDGDADLLVIGWGSTYGADPRRGPPCPRAGATVARLHLRHLNAAAARPRRGPGPLRQGPVPREQHWASSQHAAAEPATSRTSPATTA